MFGVPIDFVLFGLTLLGVALFHQRTLEVAVTGLVAITAYKILFSPFPTGSGISGLVWNLTLLLRGFALLSRHFEKSHAPLALPRLLPDDWKGCFALLAIVFMLSAFLDNIAAALVGGALAHSLFKRVHI